MSQVGSVSANQPVDRTLRVTVTNSLSKLGTSVPFAGVLNPPLKGRFSVNGPVFGALREGHSQSSVPSHHSARQGLRRRQDSPGEDDRERTGRGGPHSPLDPLLCQLAIQFGITPSVGLNAGGAAELPAASPLREDLQNLITGLARRVAWGGDRRKGSARIELSVGPLAGSTLIVHAEQRLVTVELELAPGASLGGEWQQRIVERLSARGFSAQVRVG